MAAVVKNYFPGVDAPCPALNYTSGTAAPLGFGKAGQPFRLVFTGGTPPPTPTPTYAMIMVTT